MPVDGPAYPDEFGAHDDIAEPAMGWRGRIAIVAVIVIVLLIVILHLTGTVGPSAH